MYPLKKVYGTWASHLKIGKSLEKLFYAAYHIALRERPYTDFVHELEIQKSHKVEFFKSGSYENELACREFNVQSLLKVNIQSDS